MPWLNQIKCLHKKISSGHQLKNRQQVSSWIPWLPLPLFLCMLLFFQAHWILIFSSSSFLVESPSTTWLLRDRPWYIWTPCQAIQAFNGYTRYLVAYHIILWRVNYQITSSVLIKLFACYLISLGLTPAYDILPHDGSHSSTSSVVIKEFACYLISLGLTPAYDTNIHQRLNLLYKMICNRIRFFLRQNQAPIS